jgi:hypothetical protein
MAVNRLNVGATNQLLAKASSGQSTNILELQNTAGVTVAGVDASGNGVGGLAHPPTFKNLIINGDMQVAQRATSVTGVTATSYNTADRWLVSASSLGTWTQSVETDAPTGSGFRKSVKMLCTTADASPAASDFLLFNQQIEGQNLQHIAKGTSSAKQLTVSFWVKSNVTGTYIVYLYDNDNNREVSASYTISASATWEKKTITFPADTTGAFDNDNGASLQLGFWLAAGSDRSSGTLNTSWNNAVAANRAAGQTNVAAATNNYWQITGVQLEVGSTATEFEFLPADVELVRCQRYYQKSYNTNTNPQTNNTIPGILNSPITSATQNGVIGDVRFKVEMRAAPTTTVYTYTSSTANAISNSAGTDLAVNTGFPNGAGTSGFGVYNTSGGTVTITNGAIWHFVASAEL